MGTMNVSLPDSLKSYVDDRVATGAFASSSEFVRALIRADQDRQRLRDLLLAGGASAPTEPADEAYFAGLRQAALRPQAD